MCLINLSELSASFNNNKPKSKTSLTNLRDDFLPTRDDDNFFFKFKDNFFLGNQRLMAIHSLSNDYISFFSFSRIKLLVGASISLSLRQQFS